MSSQAADVRPPIAVTTTARPGTRERLLSLDVFRGLTVAAMLLVNDPGTWSSIYPPLEHAEWHGWTPTDLIFPFFLFIVGITTHLSLEARRARGADDAALKRQILRRGALIFLFGLLQTGFPYFTWTAIPGNPDPSFVARIIDRLLHWRMMGVLQRIGLAYTVAALVTFGATAKRIVITLAVLLVGYWIVMMAIPVPDTGATGFAAIAEAPHTMAAWWDRLLLDWSRFGLGNHNWSLSLTWDPEGVLSTIGAISTAMLGVLAGRWIASGASLADRLNGLFAGGAMAIAVGGMWNWAFPINKNIWTSSYVVFTAGAAAVTLATIMWLVDARGWRGWTRPFVIYGTNPIIAFMGSEIMARLIYSIIVVPYHGKPTPLQTAIYDAGFASWLSPINASLAFAVAFVLFWYAILYVLYRRGLFFKV